MEPDQNAQTTPPVAPPQKRSYEQPLSPEEAERRARVAYLRSVARPHEHKGRRLKLALIILLVLLLLGAGAYYWFVVRESAIKPAPRAANTSDQKTPKEEPVSTKNAHHDYAPLSLGIDYPDNWKVSEENNKLTLLSGATTLKTASGSSTKGQIQITVQPKQTTIADFKSGNAVAILASEKITYAKPTQSQRAETYVSFLKHATTTTNSIDSIYVTGDAGYQKDQAIPMVDVVRGDPLIAVTFLKCANDACGGTGSIMSIAPDNWSASSSLAKTIKTVLMSLTVL